MKQGLWDRETVALLLVAAHVPLAVIWLWHGSVASLAVFGLVVLVLAAWQLLFVLTRTQPPSLSALMTALAVAMLAPEELGFLRLVIGVSFGAVMGELIFGGWGRNVVHPATVTLAFLGFGFPGFAWPEFVTPVAWAAIPTVLLGVVLGVMPAAVVAGALLSAVVASWAGVLPDAAIAPAGIVLALLVLDPVTSATTVLGRWLNGALYAGLVALFASGWHGAAAVQIAVAAALLTSLAVPLLDEVAVSLWLLQRRRRNGRS